MTKILLVEDDKSLREIYGVRLQAEGYEIVSAGDGEEALAVAIKERPALLLSDVMMPKISGFDMLNILRNTAETKDMKVIMMTALSSEDQRARGESLGADRYLVKSQVGIEDVVRTVHDVLGDGVPSAAPAPSFPPAAAPAAPAAPAPAAAPTSAPSEPSVAAAPAMPEPAPAVPAAPVMPDLPPAAPSPELTMPPQPAPMEPAAAPVINMPEPAPAPAAPVAPAAPPIQPPEPVAMPAYEPAAPFSAPAPAPAPLPTPAPAPASLPQPTAPFSSPAPASLGDRVINPLPTADGLQQPTNDIAAQMSQELNAASSPTPPQPPQPPVPPAPAA